MRAAIYLRVSTDGQTTENQEPASFGRLRSASGTRSSRSIAMPASRARRAGISVLASMPCTRTRPGAGSTW
jgi:hypothetical protein